MQSSNGKYVGEDVYVYVDISSCRIKPSRLLFDFYSIDMENGPYEVKNLKEEFKHQKKAKKNLPLYGVSTLVLLCT